MLSYILLTCNPGNEKEIITKIKRMKEVVEVNGIWGKYDIFIKVSYDDPFEIDNIVARLRRIENVTNTYTMPVLYGQGGSIED